MSTDGRRIELLRVFPIYPEEVEIKRVRGARWFVRQVLDSGAFKDRALAAPILAGSRRSRGGRCG